MKNNLRYIDDNWHIYTEKGKLVMNNLEYLNYLLQKSKHAIETFNKLDMKCLIWDLEEIPEQELSFYKQYRIVIDSEIKALRRLIKYEKLPHKKLVSEPEPSPV